MQTNTTVAVWATYDHGQVPGTPTIHLDVVPWLATLDAPALAAVQATSLGDSDEMDALIYWWASDQGRTVDEQQHAAAAALVNGCDAFDFSFYVDGDEVDTAAVMATVNDARRRHLGLPTAPPAPSEGIASDKWRSVQIDTIKRIYTVSKRVASTVVDTGDADLLSRTVGVPILDDELAACLTAAVAAPSAAGTATLVEMLSNHRVAVEEGQATSGVARLLAGAHTTFVLDEHDWSTITMVTSAGRLSTLKTHLPTHGHATNVKNAVKVAATIGIVPQQRCGHCNQLLTDTSTASMGQRGAQAWCDRCCNDRDLWACETCGQGYYDAHDGGHRNGSGAWCNACHDPATDGGVCDVHDSTCFDG